jgi:hypothetical protein
MSLPDRHMKFWTIVLLVVLLSLPFSGADYLSQLTDSSGTNHTGFVCAHEDADSGHESPQDGHRHISHCYELDAPCDTTPPLVLDYPPVISTLTLSDRCLREP